MSKLDRMQATTYVVSKTGACIEVMAHHKSRQFSFLPNSFRVFATREEAEVFIMTNKLSEGAAWN